MSLEALPSEVLSLILENLVDTEGCHLGSETGLYIHCHLANARLVCREWNALATPHIFKRVALRHNSEGTFDSWNEMMDSPTVKHAAQHVILDSAPEDLEGREYDAWQDWEAEGEYPALTKAIARIKDLPNLKSLALCFSDNCYGVDSDRPMEEEFEVLETRQNFLTAVFDALHARPASPIQALTIWNLQNMPIPNITSSDAFREAIRAVKSLRLHIATECNEHGPDHDIECVERWTYEPHLQHEFLPLAAEQLTSLSLCFNEEWGVAPGYFDGRSLSFPRLKSLHLGNYIIGHHDQFDWILNISSLSSLHLESCCISSHLRLWTDQSNLWGLKTHDWETHPRGAFGFTREDDLVYTFDKTWESVFDGIRARLSNLTALRIDYPDFRNPSCFFLQPNMTEVLELSPKRYITLDTGLLPSPWIDAKADGRLEFGNNVADPVDLDSTVNRYISLGELNRAEETKQGDGRAWEDLFKTIRARR